jgi:nucleoside-diphosphate-sugar epimerase
VNRDGTRSVLQAALDMRVASIVLVSDLALFGPTGADEEADETRLEKMRPPNNPYLQSRLAAEEIAREFVAKDLAVKLVYPGMGYGCVRPPGHGGLAEHTLLHLAQGKPAVTPGSGRNLLALTYFKDTAQAIILAQELGRVGQRYLLIGERLTWPELWADVAEVLGQEIHPRRLPRWLARLNGALPPNVMAWATRNWNYRNDKARRDLGWRPHSFHESMTETWEEYQALGWGTQAGRPVRAMRRA